MKKLQMMLSVLLLLVASFSVYAQSGVTDLRPGESRSVTTVQLSGLPTAFGGSDSYYAIFRISGMKPGQRYEATMTYEAGTDIGYAHSWIDGNPFSRDWHSFVGIGTGTGTRRLPGKQEKFLFSIDRASKSDALYLIVRSNKPWNFSFSVGSPSGVNKDSRDKWDYYFVSDFDVNKYSPFLLKR